MILAGDVGGTKTNLALFRSEGGRLVRLKLRTFPSRDFPSLSAVIEAFLEGGGRADLACIGVAGPVLSGRSRLTNLPWVVDEETIRIASGARRGLLINDLQAAAFSVPFLPPESLAVLQGGTPDPRGVVVVAAAGTGLGVSFLVPSDGSYRPFPTEGGHVDFAPRDDREARLLAFFRTLHGGRVSVERVVSGPGLSGIYRFLREAEGATEDPVVDGRIRRGDPPRVIAEEGCSGRSATCRAALDLFASLYGAVAGNLALQFLATGGVVLGGGVAPAILPVPCGGPFLDAFLEKGRFRGFLLGVPVKVILDDFAALLGAAHFVLASEGSSA
jgi:glucokinase